MKDMSETRKFPEPVEALLLILAIFGTLILSIVLLAAFQDNDLEKTEQLIQNSRLFYIWGGSLFFIVPLAYARWRKYPIRSLFRLNPVPLPVILISIPIGLALTVIGDELDRLIGMLIDVPPWVYEMMHPLKASGFGDWVLILIGAVLVAAVAEEVLFRGFLQVTLERKGDVTRAVLLSSITWTLVHQNPYWAPEIFIQGVFIGYLAWRTNSIIPAVIVHGLNNLIGVYMLNRPQLAEQMTWYEWHNHVSPLVLVVALFLLVTGIRQLTNWYRGVS